MRTVMPKMRPSGIDQVNGSRMVSAHVHGQTRQPPWDDSITRGKVPQSWRGAAKRLSWRPQSGVGANELALRAVLVVMFAEACQPCETLSGKPGKNSGSDRPCGYLHTFVKSARDRLAAPFFHAFLLARPQTVPYPKTTRYFRPTPCARFGVSYLGTLLRNVSLSRTTLLPQAWECAPAGSNSAHASDGTYRH
jgi:hypothetical protein